MGDGMLTIRPLTFDRIAYAAASLWPADREELDAAGIADCEAMLREALPDCAWAEEARWGDHAIAVYGVRPIAGRMSTGVPWMLTTTHMEGAERMPVFYAARGAVRRMRDQFDVLVNFVHGRNLRAQKFIRCLGFKIDETPTGPNGAFLRFKWERAHV